MISFLSNKRDAHLQYVCIICVKFQIDRSETVGVDYTNLASYIGHFSKNSMFEMGVILPNMICFFPKKQVHIFSMPETFVQRFRFIAQKLWEELIVQTFLGARDRRTDRRTGVKHNAH